MKNLILIFTLLAGFAMSQDIDVYFALLENGQIERVERALTDLEIQYPNNDGIQYLKILTVLNGDSAQQLFENFIELYPNSNYTDDAEIKLGEYLYARGLYSQASKRLQTIPLKYPDSDQLARTIRLLTKSYQATGELDSLAYYLDLFTKQVGSLDSAAATGSEYLVVIEAAELSGSASDPVIQPEENATIVQAQRFRPWVIQVGAFRAESNANQVKGRLDRGGEYEVLVVKTIDNGLTLYAVQIVRYDSKTEAERIGRSIAENFGLDYRIFYRP
jgi:tetratricopeptide (TPR) repeat protein